MSANDIIEIVAHIAALIFIGLFVAWMLGVFDK